MQLRSSKLWVRYAVMAVVFTVIFQAAYNYIQFYAPIDQTARDNFFLQFFILLASTNLFSLVVAIDYSRKAGASIEIFDRAAFVINRVFSHHTLRGLTEEEAADKMISVLDHMEQARPILEGLGKIKPHHIERGVRMLNLLLSASDKLDDSKLEAAFGKAVGKKLEAVLNDTQT